jgi:hypothetical protein
VVEEIYGTQEEWRQWKEGFQDNRKIDTVSGMENTSFRAYNRLSGLENLNQSCESAENQTKSPS